MAYLWVGGLEISGAQGHQTSPHFHQILLSYYFPFCHQFFSGKPGLFATQVRVELSEFLEWGCFQCFLLVTDQFPLKKFVINSSSSASAWAFDRSLVISTLWYTAGRSLGSLCCWDSHCNWFRSLITQTFLLNNSMARVWKMAAMV